jgi:RND family efflux transporter MFP subunit
LKEAVTPYLELAGTTSAIASVNLVARVVGYLTAIGYTDGAVVKAGDLLFQIDQAPYIAQVKKGEADVLGAQAELLQAQAEFGRQSTLLRDNVTAQATMDLARAKRDSNQANVEAKQATLQMAGIDLSYTQIHSPFDGMATRHLFSKGELVGTPNHTDLASVVQLDPIYVLLRG